MQHFTHLPDLRAAVQAAKAAGKAIGFVPTMGALHHGHIALVKQSLSAGCYTVVSVFVNPKQFGPQEDLARYPRDVAGDSALLAQAGADALYVPAVEAIYPPGFSTEVRVAGVSQHLCGAFRPVFFAGVATVVAKLLTMVAPNQAYFGEKDWQQLQVIRRLVADLAIPTQIIGVPTVREADGLALSSRNRYLNAEDRSRATLIPATLQRLAAAIAKKPGNSAALLAAERYALTQQGLRLDYLELADAETCTPTLSLARPARLFIAAFIGTTRLIDNWPLVLE